MYNMDNELKVIITGPTDFEDYELLKGVCNKLLEDRIRKGYKITILSGHSKGADILGERYADECGFEKKLFEPKERHGSKANSIRNTKMISEANALIVFTKKDSQGIQRLIKHATDKHLIVREITEEQQNLLKNAYDSLN